MDTDKIMEEELHNMEIAESIENMPPAEKEPMSTILLIGSSGAGKTTLVNTVFDTRMASSNTFSGGNTPDIRVSENAALNYRVIDTMGLELGFTRQLKSLRQVKKYMENLIKTEDRNSSIDVIWYCVDSNAYRLFKENVDQVASVYKHFPNAPVFIVLTKAFGSEYQNAENERTVEETFRKYDPKGRIKIAGVVSVNSQPFMTANNDMIGISGIDRLITMTNEVIPEARRNGRENIRKGIEDSHMKQANVTVAIASCAGATIGAVPIPFPDATVLTPLQTAMVKSVTKIYHVESDVLVTAIIDASVVTFAARTVLNALKAVPGINAAAAVLNAIVAGFFTFITGEAAIFVCSRIERGDIKPDDLESIKTTVTGQAKKITEKYMPILVKGLGKKEGSTIEMDDVRRIFKTFSKNPKKID